MIGRFLQNLHLELVRLLLSPLLPHLRLHLQHGVLADWQTRRPCYFFLILQGRGAPCFLSALISRKEGLDGSDGIR